MSDLNNNFCFSHYSNTYTHQYPAAAAAAAGDAENSQFNNHKIEMQNSQFNQAAANHHLINYNSNNAFAFAYAYNNNHHQNVYPMVQPPPSSDLNIYQNFGGPPNIIPKTSSSSSSQFLTTTTTTNNNYSIIDHNSLLPNQNEPHQDFLEPFCMMNSHEKDDYSLSFILQSGREICSMLKNNSSVRSTIAENTSKTTIGQLMTMMPQNQGGTSSSMIGHDQSYSNNIVVQASQNHRPNEISLIPREEEGRVVMVINQGGNNPSPTTSCSRDDQRYYFTVLNSQDPPPAVTPPQVTSGGTTRGGTIQARRQTAAPLRNYQLPHDQGMSSNQRSFNRLSRSSSECDDQYNMMRWRSSSAPMPLRSSFETDNYPDRRTWSNRPHSWRDETQQQINPFSYGAQYSYLQTRVPCSVGLARKLENPCEEVHKRSSTVHQQHTTPSKTADALMPQSHPSFPNNNMDSKSMDMARKSLKIVASSSNNVTSGGNYSSINSTETAYKMISTAEIANGEKERDGEEKDQMLFRGDADNMNAEDDDFNEHFLMTTDRFGFDV